MGRYVCGLLLALLSGSPTLAIDVTSNLINLVVYFENVAFPDSWLGFTQDNQTITIDILEIADTASRYSTRTDGSGT